MTCPRVPWVHPTCLCGRLLELGVDHGDDELGNPLCPTCSRCGCEPTERKTMTPEELRALPEDAIVLIEGDPLVKEGGRFRYLTPGGSRLSAADLEDYATHVVLHPAPEPDHSMCARLVQRGVRIGSADGPLDPSLTWWELEAPNGDVLLRINGDDAARRYGFAIPEPEPTVVERAAAEIQRADERGDDSYKDMARALAKAGLLREDAS